MPNLSTKTFETIEKLAWDSIKIEAIQDFCDRRVSFVKPEHVQLLQLSIPQFQLHHTESSNTLNNS